MWTRSFFVLMSCGLLAGCATMETGSGPTQNVRFDSYPEGARVTVDGNKVGQTPTSANLTRTQDHTAQFDLPGYPSHVVVLKHGPNTAVVKNFLFPGPPGLLVDGLSGAGKGVLTPSAVNVTMAPSNEAAQQAGSSQDAGPLPYSDTPPAQ